MAIPNKAKDTRWVRKKGVAEVVATAVFAPGMCRESLEELLRERLYRPFLSPGAPRVLGAPLQATLLDLRKALMTGVTGKMKLDQALVEEIMDGLKQLRADLAVSPELRVLLDATTERWVSTEGVGGRKDLDVELRVFRNIFASVLEDGARWRGNTDNSSSRNECETSHEVALKILHRTEIVTAEDTQSAPSSPSGRRVGVVYGRRETVSDVGDTDEKKLLNEARLVSRVASSKVLHNAFKHNLKQELRHEHEVTQGLMTWAKEAMRDRTHVALMPTPWSRPSRTEKTQRHITFQITGSSVRGGRADSDNGMLLGGLAGRRHTPNSPSLQGLRRSMSAESLGACILRSSDSSEIHESLPTS